MSRSGLLGRKNIGIYQRTTHRREHDRDHRIPLFHVIRSWRIECLGRTVTSGGADRSRWDEDCVSARKTCWSSTLFQIHGSSIADVRQKPVDVSSPGAGRPSSLQRMSES